MKVWMSIYHSVFDFLDSLDDKSRDIPLSVSLSCIFMLKIEGNAIIMMSTPSLMMMLTLMLM